jgi:hypothetical protein
MYYIGERYREHLSDASQRWTPSINKADQALQSMIRHLCVLNPLLRMIHMSLKTILCLTMLNQNCKIDICLLYASRRSTSQ